MVESENMVASPRKAPDPPVGVIESLTGGFETVASHVGLILLPAALDLFLWLGPRLSINPIMQKLIDLLNSVPAPDTASAENQRTTVEFFKAVGERANVFNLLSTAPLGVPSMMAGQLPDALPGGRPVVLFLNNELLFLILALACLLLGLLLGAAYFSLIGSLLRDPKLASAEVARRIIINWAKLAAFGILFVILAFFISVPFVLAVGLLQVLASALLSAVAGGGLAALLIGLAVTVWNAVLLWMLLYAAFALHGMVLKDRGVFGAIWDSARLVQWNLMAAMGLFIVIFLINWGLGYVWSLPKPDSWLTLAGIGGHAFVSTGLVAATFVFYKDRYRWWIEMREWLLATRGAQLK